MSDGIPTALRQTIVETAKGICAYCHSQEALMGVTFEVDHIIPHSKGGNTSLENLCLSCPTCNRHKSKRTEAADPITHQIFPFYHPLTDFWADHFVWSEDSSKLLALTPVARVTIEALKINRPALIQLRLYWAATHHHPPTDDPRRRN